MTLIYTFEWEQQNEFWGEFLTTTCSNYIVSEINGNLTKVK